MINILKKKKLYQIKKCDKKHEHLLSIIGGVNSKQANVLGLPNNSNPPFVTTSDDYITLLSLPNAKIKPIINDRFSYVSVQNQQNSNNTTQLTSRKILDFGQVAVLILVLMMPWIDLDKLNQKIYLHAMCIFMLMNRLMCVIKLNTLNKD